METASVGQASCLSRLLLLIAQIDRRDACPTGKKDASTEVTVKTTRPFAPNSLLKSKLP